MLANVTLLLPELVLFIGAMGLLMVGAFATTDATRIVEYGAISLLVIAAIASWLQGEAYPQLAFGGAFIVDAFSAFMKTLTYLATAVVIIMARGFMQNENLARFEVPVLMVLAAVGICMMISANDLIALYMGIELQSLALYVLAAIKRDSLRATEAGLKYFVLGALSSGMLLYGASLIYGFREARILPVLPKPSPQKTAYCPWRKWSAWCFCLPVLHSKFPPFLSTCGRRMSMKVRRHQ